MFRRKDNSDYRNRLLRLYVHTSCASVFVSSRVAPPGRCLPPCRVHLVHILNIHRDDGFDIYILQYVYTCFLGSP
jgi:hypothetical protein